VPYPRQLIADRPPGARTQRRRTVCRHGCHVHHCTIVI